MAKRSSNQVRIIGGIHRGRRITFPDLPGLRPSGDRVRETLFNWLQPIIPHARCLDLFAGSGALGLEAASRGAGEVVMLDRAPQVVRQLEANKALLDLPQVKIIQTDALSWLAGEAQPFDLIFVDPPFAADLLGKVCEILAHRRCLAQGGLVYLEDTAGRDFIGLPTDWQIVKQSQAGRVRFGLVGER
jgi:16S rRNA (guanine966-N2)-methyltransferase